MKHPLRLHHQVDDLDFIGVLLVVVEASKDLYQVQVAQRRYSKFLREVRSELIGRCASAVQTYEGRGHLEEEKGRERIGLGGKVGLAGQTETNFVASAVQKDKEPRL